MGIPVGARILMRDENSKGVWDIQHLIGIPRIVPKSHWGSGAKRRLLRWTSMNRQMMEAIEVDQLIETNNGGLN